ncbi:MAG: hypothetical protein AMJ64_04415 [Betaproteobacteria bacterium SG8_39]|nr:MAG: hypothetical protein AMJ64_04415 [Betaproteobacteria bacterium SG8_39]
MNDAPQPPDPHAAPGEAADNLRTLTAVVYGLQAGAFLIGLSAIVAVVINYVKKEEVAGTWLESHFRWQIRTFWFGLLWGVIGGLLFVVVIGWFILMADAVWIIYRIVKGWLNLNDGKPMPVPA